MLSPSTIRDTRLTSSLSGPFPAGPPNRLDPIPAQEADGRRPAECIRAVFAACVGRFNPNALDLSDMRGNVGEYYRDAYSPHR